MENNPTLAAKLKADSAAAAYAIDNWKQGTPSQNAIEALNLVIDDLDLVCPANGPCGSYAPLIALALGTAESIIAILNPTTQTYGTRAQVRKVNLGYYPKDAKSFKVAWNGICAGDTGLAGAVIK
jgi:ABC-type molybdate transport system substrate-binding protein